MGWTIAVAVFSIYPWSSSTLMAVHDVCSIGDKSMAHSQEQSERCIIVGKRKEKVGLCNPVALSSVPRRHAALPNTKAISLSLFKMAFISLISSNVNPS